MKNLVILCAIFSFLTSCKQKKEDIKEIETNTFEVEQTFLNVLLYEGTLPCADCSGIKTTLKIAEGDGTMESHLFELSRTYLGKEKDNTFVKSGKYNTERGFKTDNDATIYVLNWDKDPKEQEYFVRYSNDPKVLYQLDRERKKINSGMNYSLKLVE